MAGDSIMTSNPAPRRKSILSIRARLIVLALLAVAPLMFEHIRGLEGARAKHTARAQTQVTDLAKRGVLAQRNMVYSIRAFLQVVARVYVTVPFNPHTCNQYLSDLTGNMPWIRTLSIAGPNGQIKCSTDSMAVGLSVSDRPHFQSALHKRDFVLSDYLISRLNQAPSLVATFPAIGDDGSVIGVVLGVINLPWIGDLTDITSEEPDASAILIDGSGTLMAASADEADLVGKRFAEQDLIREMLAHDEGNLTTTDLNGVRRIYAYARVPWTQARLAVGLNENAVHSSIDHELNVAYSQLLMIVAFVLLVAWFGGEKLIVQPIRSLTRKVTRLGRGDLKVRTAHESWAAEFEPLAIAFDDMARKLAVHEEELRIANEHLEELASLDGLTGLANRRGFDRQLDREWQRAIERSNCIALMMIDIDHFKLYNDRYGHVAGDACLRAVGETLSLITLDDAVLVARYGGEEFALLLPGLTIERAAAIAGDARKAIEDLFMVHGESPHGFVTISIGVESQAPVQGQSPARLVEAADRALYEAKRRGRNMVIAHIPASAGALRQDQRRVPSRPLMA